MNDLPQRDPNRERESFHPEGWGSIVLWRFDRAVEGTRVYFSTRLGGVSERPYDSLNLGYHVGDSHAQVLHNRELLGEHFGFPPGKLTSPRQRHSAEIRMLEREHEVGTGADGSDPPTSLFDPCDGLVTAMRRTPILLHFADCVPVVVTVRAGLQMLLGVIHAGRAGLVQGVVANGVAHLRRMAAAAGLDEVSAALGPSIGPCCYEVSDLLAAEFTARFGDKVAHGNHLDLRQAARQELEDAGIAAADIHLLDICTACDDDFYSYRREGVTGRQGALAWIE